VNDEENRWEDAAAFIDAGLSVHSMSPRSVHDVAAEIRALAERLEVALPGRFGTDEWDAWTASVLSHAGTTRSSPCGDVRGCRWRAIPTLVAPRRARREQRVRRFADRYPQVTLDEVAARAPNLILLPSEPYAFGPEHLPDLTRQVGGVPVVFVDGRDLFLVGRPYPRRRCQTRRRARWVNRTVGRAGRDGVRR